MAPGLFPCTRKLAGRATSATSAVAVAPSDPSNRALAPFAPVFIRRDGAAPSTGALPLDLRGIPPLPPRASRARGRRPRPEARPQTLPGQPTASTPRSGAFSLPKSGTFSAPVGAERAASGAIDWGCAFTALSALRRGTMSSATRRTDPWRWCPAGMSAVRPTPFGGISIESNRFASWVRGTSRRT